MKTNVRQRLWEAVAAQVADHLQATHAHVERGSFDRGTIDLSDPQVLDALPPWIFADEPGPREVFVLFGNGGHWAAEDVATEVRMLRRRLKARRHLRELAFAASRNGGSWVVLAALRGTGPALPGEADGLLGLVLRCRSDARRRSYGRAAGGV